MNGWYLILLLQIISKRKTKKKPKVLNEKPLKKRNTHETQLEFAIGNSHSEFLFVFYIYYITYAIQTPCVSVVPSLEHLISIISWHRLIN